MPEYQEIMRALADGTLEDFKMIAQAVEGFPHGVDDVVGRHWIINAIDCGSLAAVAWMLRKGVSVNFCDDEGFTVLHSCIDRDLLGKYEILRLLIAAGADLDAKGFNDWTPLHRAAARDDMTALKILLDAGADRTVRTGIDDCATPAEEAKMLGRYGAAKFIEDFE